MTNFTKKAIKESFLKLLNEKPLSKISVKDIVEDCGINRNSFYYHYQDMPALIEEIITEETEELIQRYPTIHSLSDCFSAAFSFALKNKKAAYHIYHSVSRDIFEQYLMKMCEYAVNTYIDTAFQEKEPSGMQEQDRRILIRFIQCECFGLIIDWLNNGMNDEAIQDLIRLTELCRGLPEEWVRRSVQDSQTK